MNEYEYTCMDLMGDVVESIMTGGFNDYEKKVSGKVYQPSFADTFAYLEGSYRMYMRLTGDSDESTYIMRNINFIDMLMDDARYDHDGSVERGWDESDEDAYLALKLDALTDIKNALYKFLNDCEQELNNNI